ncbi:hypothetical protein D9X30_0416 [Cupriavidus sp. U2]|uniref:hypothetical protein n=1 Tax=Cupriavidus sp. U2 TaxID=2920269 RepID=UPI00129EDEFA|nr:hypothetical protein [Cupriavidus sp. U2]KAI3594184.1 hypothetical protein D9X30_0416 [Cupriavidus sp. U2]
MSALLAFSGVFPLSSTPGLTSDAVRVAKASAEEFYRVRKSTKTNAVTNELFALAAKYDRLSRVTLKVAVDFALALPTDAALPEVSVDPDGEVAFDWIDDNKMLSVSIGSGGGVTYAGKFGAERVSGTARFSRSVPQPLNEALKSFRAG